MWSVQRADHVEQRTFSGARFPDHRDVLSLWDGKADIFQRVYGSFAAAVRLADIFDLQ